MLSYPSFSKSQLLYRFPLLLSGTACVRNPIHRPHAASPKSRVLPMRAAARNPIIYPRRLNYEFTGFIHASVVSLIQRDPEFRSRGSTEKPCKYKDFPRRTPRDFTPYGNGLENRENAYSRSMNFLVNTHLFCPNFLFILPGAKERNSGSHEVSGSIPLISTKTKSHSVRNGFFVLAGHTWREKRCGSTECIFAAQKRRFFCMQCRKHKKMQSARRRRSRRSIPLIVPLSFLENRLHFFSHAT